jgi:hypothetical protein
MKRVVDGKHATLATPTMHVGKAMMANLLQVAGRLVVRMSAGGPRVCRA